MQIESAHIALCSIVGHAPKPNLIPKWNRNHFAQSLFARIGEIHFDGEPFNRSLNVGWSKDQLPTRWVLQTVAGNKMWIRNRYPIMMGFNYLYTQWIGPAAALLGIEHQTDLIANEFVEIGWWIAWMPQIQWGCTRMSGSRPALWIN